MDTKDFIISSCAVVGALLGIFNLARNYLTDAERLRVMLWTGDDEHKPSIEVVNISPFAVWVTELGDVFPDLTVVKVMLDRNYVEQNTVPCKIDGRASHMFYLDFRNTIAAQLNKRAYCYAKTALGNIFTSEPRPIRYLRRAKEIARLQQPTEFDRTGR